MQIVNEIENEEQPKYNEISTQTDEYLSEFNNLTYSTQENNQKEIKQDTSLIMKSLIKHKPKRLKDIDEISIISDDLFSNKNRTEILGKKT